MKEKYITPLIMKNVYDIKAPLEQHKAKKEIMILFPKDELFLYKKNKNLKKSIPPITPEVINTY
jgi:hypothetical protein